MNLAIRDIRHNLGRFALTILGVGTLLMVVMAMGGIYRGLIEEGTLLVDRMAADVWVVQRNTRGPIAEISRVPRNLVDRVAAVPGLESPREFVMHTIQRENNGKRLRMVVVGLSWPTDKGEWIPLIAGRALARNHYEMIADQSLGLRLGQVVRLGKDNYTVVGLTKSMTSWGGDGTAFFTLTDAQAIQFDLPGEAVRLERQARRARSEQQDASRAQPSLLERAFWSSSNIPALGPPMVSAVVARIAPGADPDAVVRTISGWSDVSVITHQGQQDLILKGAVERSRRQLGLFRLILTVVSALVMTLIVYTLTLDKLHDLAMLKLIGAPKRVILGMIVQQAILLGMLGFVTARLLAIKLFPLFPRRIVLKTDDLVQLGVVVFGISVLASGLGVWRALRVSPNEALTR
ncbi:MAG: ABC transporter permease [Planctomycetes bacterium]|nr:ABC transporter permease [Planctomycetota bacterium]